MWKLIAKPERLIACYADRRAKKIQRWHIRKASKVHNGELSTNARRKLKQAIRWLIACSDEKKVYEKKQKRTVNYKINLLTLTFRENLQDDNLARQLLGMWFDMAKHRFELHQYVWKAEPQARGAIHFHVATGNYIPHTELKYTWNRLCTKRGLAQENCNSTDVHAVVGVKNLEAYLTEYLANENKHEGRRKIAGRLWGCSHGISKAGKQFLLIDNEELISISNELTEFSLYEKLKREGKEIPAAIQHIGYWILPNNYYTNLPECDLKNLWMQEITTLRQKRQLQFWPHTPKP